MTVRRVLLGLGMAGLAWAQSAPPPQPAGEQARVPAPKHTRSPGKEMGSGAKDIGTGAAKGAGNLGKGSAKGAVDLVTLHPIDGAASVGKGAGAAGEDVAVGTVKGTAKVTKGVAKGLKKIL